MVRTARSLVVLLTLSAWGALPGALGDEPGRDPVATVCAALDPGDDTSRRLAAALASIEGRAALADALEASEVWHRADRLRRGMEVVLEELAAEDGVSAEHMQEAVPQQIESHLEVLGRTVEHLARQLVVDHAVAADLAAFLARPETPRILYQAFVQRFTRPAWPGGGLGRWFAVTDDGRLGVPSILVPSSDAWFGRVDAASAAVERLKVELPGVAADLPSLLRARVQALATDDAALAYVLGAAGVSRLKKDPAEVAEALLESLRRRARGERMGGLWTEASRFAGFKRDWLRAARAHASRIGEGGEQADRWRAYLRSPLALLLPRPVPRASPKSPDILLNRSHLGRALVIASDGTTRVNRHAVWELDVLLRGLERQEAESASAREAVRAFGAELPEGELRGVVRSEAGIAYLVDVATREAGHAPIDAWKLWTDRVLVKSGSTWCVREGAREEVDALIRATSRVKAELEAGRAASAIDPTTLDYQTAHLDLLRSSIFFNPRTSTGHWLYFTQFDDHHAARLFGTFGWNAKVCKDLEDFKARIRARTKGLERLAATHDKLIVHLSGVPPWLSTWKGDGTFEAGGWEDKQAYPPKDVEVWKAMVKELALVMRGLEGVERYYEFWNEPDLQYWQGSLDDFLALYEATARVVKGVDPQGKVGGCATNQWDGRIHKKATSDALNLELIRYARAHAVPLDFVSWHHFGRPVAHIEEAKAAYLAEWRKVGFEGEPEWLITEWSNAYRGMAYANATFADLMLGFFHAGVTAQCASCWEEFHKKPDPKHFAPWGLLTQQGQRKNCWYVHRFFDRLARESQGVAAVTTDDDRTIVVSKKAGDVYDVLLWERRTEPRMKAAWERLEASGFTQKDGRRFGTIDRLERAIASGETVAPGWTEAFAAARSAYHAHPVQTARWRLRFEGVESVEVLFAESVRMEHRLPRPAVLGNEIVLRARPFEVVRLQVRAR